MDRHSCQTLTTTRQDGRILVRFLSVRVHENTFSGSRVLCPRPVPDFRDTKLSNFVGGAAAVRTGSVFTSFHYRHYVPWPRAWRKDKQMDAMCIPLAVSFVQILTTALISVSRRAKGFQRALATAHLWVFAVRWFLIVKKTHSVLIFIERWVRTVQKAFDFPSVLATAHLWVFADRLLHTAQKTRSAWGYLARQDSSVSQQERHGVRWPVSSYSMGNGGSSHVGGTALDLVSPEPFWSFVFWQPSAKFSRQEQRPGLCSVISKMNSFLCLLLFRYGVSF